MEKILYTVVLLDVAESRKYDLERRSEIQNCMAEKILLMNRLFSESLVMPFEFTGGDGIIGMLNNSAKSNEKEWEEIFMRLMLPLSMHVAVSIDTMNELILNDPVFNTMNMQTGQALWNVKAKLKQ